MLKYQGSPSKKVNIKESCVNTETDNNISKMDIEYVDILTEVALMYLIYWSNGSSSRR